MTKCEKDSFGGDEAKPLTEDEWEEYYKSWEERLRKDYNLQEKSPEGITSNQ